MIGSEPGRVGPSRVLLTALGTRAEEATYRLGDGRVTASLAPLALLQLLEDPAPDLVLAVCTDRAAEVTLPVLRERLDEMGLRLEVVRVPEATTAHELTKFVETVAKRVTRCCAHGALLSVDLTHGYRHHAVLLYVTALYLASLDRLEVEHVWYAPLAKDQDAEVLDLQPLLLLPRAVHAVQELRESGSARSLGRLLAREPREGTDVRRAVDGLTRALVAGLPIEAGMEARKVLTHGNRLHDEFGAARALRRVLERLHVPLSGVLVGDLTGLLAPLVVGAEKKVEVVLDKAELARQATLVDLLVEWGTLHIAIGLMREWVVSWSVWSSRRGQPVAGRDWLDREERRRAERLLNSLRLYAADADLCSLLTSDQRQVADFWGRLCSLRNAYMHFGMQGQRIDPFKKNDGSDLQKAWKEVRCSWQAFKSEPSVASLEVSSEAGRVLVSALGLSPGVLTNAVRTVRAVGGGDPDCVVVFCSRESGKLVANALTQARWTGQLIVRTIEDPFATVDLMRPRKGLQLPDDPELRRVIAGADTVFVNLTGGTTPMGLLAQQVAQAAVALERRLCRFALADRRSPEEQRADPWAECEAVFLDEETVTDEA